MKRITSGNAQLDSILGGGFPARSIHIIMGDPGAGKTMLAEQTAFAGAQSERPVLYVTTLSEPASKFIAFLQQTTFADVSLIGTRILYESIAAEASAKPESVHEAVRSLLQEHRPGILIIDSIKALSDLMPSIPAWRRVLYELAGLLSAYDTTSFWVGEYSSGMTSTLPEFAVVDGVVELTRVEQGATEERRLRVLKLRGSDFRSGLHTFRISAAGLEVFPRLVPPGVQVDDLPLRERLRSGIEGLDTMIETGWLRSTATFVVGPSGAGKTVLSLHFLREGVQSGEATLLVTFQENPTQLARIMENFGWSPRELMTPGKLEVLYSSPVEMPIDVIVNDMFDRIRERRIRRVVIDSISDIERNARDPIRCRDFLYSLTQHFVAHGITSMFVMEMRAPLQDSGPGTHDLLNMSDNTLVLGIELGEDLMRTVRVMKSRGSVHDGKAHRLLIGRQGITVEGAPR